MVMAPRRKKSGICIYGAIVLFLYGVVLTFQPSYFHRIYATYGGIFVVMSLLWGWIFDKIPPDTYDLRGCLKIQIVPTIG